MPGMSESNPVPANTITVPSQWHRVNGLSTYQMEKSNERDLRNTTNSVTDGWSTRWSGGRHTHTGWHIVVDIHWIQGQSK